MKERLTILGSTGSIGLQTLDVVRAYPERFDVVALASGSNSRLLAEQAEEFKPQYLALERESGNTDLDHTGAEVFLGRGSARLLAEIPVEVVLNGIVGFAGLSATVGALENGNLVALANKESLVAGGEWVMNIAPRDRLIPVDSEHSAIFQCLDGRSGEEVDEILLTASGGPFFEKDKAELADAGPRDALKHPTWEMGAKITIDSATMMNKGLEVIEAHHLFGVPYGDIKVTVHRQSVVHGGAVFKDGSVVMHAALPDMRLPISYALLYPERVDVGAERVGFGAESWTFEEPRNDVFRCLPLAIEAGRLGGAYTVALNAANEVAVEAFLEGRIKFLQIADLIEEVLETVPDFGEMQSMESIETADRWAREAAHKQIQGSSQ